MSLKCSTSYSNQGTESSMIELSEHPINKAEDNADGGELNRILIDVKRKGIKMIRVEFTDINALTICKMIVVHTLEELATSLTRGLLFPPIFIVKGRAGGVFDSAFKDKYWFTDVCALPDLGTFRVIPWLEDTASITSVLYHLNMKDLVVEHPRNVAIIQLRRLESMGFSLMGGYEVEFRLSDAEGKEPLADITGCLGSTVLLVKAKDYIKQLIECLTQAGVPVGAIHTESPAGSLEVITKPEFGIKAADDVVTCKNACSEIALCNGYTAQFVADPDGDGDGFTLHFNHSLWDKSGNIVSDMKTGDLTDTARHWIAGLLAHARALTPLMAPTDKGIKMFRASHEASDMLDPTLVTWGRHNRSASFRLKKGDGPRGSYIENRLGRIEADPYLLLAGTVAAGLDGIINKLPLPEECTGNAHKEIPPNTPKVPCDMEEGIAALMEDKVMCEALGEGFVDLIVAARKHETKLYNTNKTDF